VLLLESLQHLVPKALRLGLDTFQSCLQVVNLALLSLLSLLHLPSQLDKLLIASFQLCFVELELMVFAQKELLVVVLHT